MSRLWRQVGVAAYYLTWPGIWLMVRWSMRTRVVIAAEGKIVVVRPWLSNGKWSLPGGGVHAGEEPALAALREVREETGLEVSPAKLKFTKTYTHPGTPLTCSYHLFTTALPRMAQLRPGKEILEARWLSAAELTASNACGDVLSAIKT